MKAPELLTAFGRWVAQGKPAAKKRKISRGFCWCRGYQAISFKKPRARKHAQATRKGEAQEVLIGMRGTRI